MDRSERDLERRAAEGDAEAEAEVLGRRLRRGDLARERLELAAELGYEPACLALSSRPPHPAPRAERCCACVQCSRGGLGSTASATATKQTCGPMTTV